MLESDSGVFRPTGFGFTGQRTARETLQQIADLLRGIQADQIGAAGGGADIGPSVEAGQVPAMSLEVEGNYFLIHHTRRRHRRQDRSRRHGQGVGGHRRHGLRVADMPDRLK